DHQDAALSKRSRARRPPSPHVSVSHEPSEIAQPPFLLFLTRSSGDIFCCGGASFIMLLAAMSISIFDACCLADSSDAPPDFETSSRSRLALVKSPFLK